MMFSFIKCAGDYTARTLRSTKRKSEEETNEEDVEMEVKETERHDMTSSHRHSRLDDVMDAQHEFSGGQHLTIPNTHEYQEARPDMQLVTELAMEQERLAALARRPMARPKSRRPRGARLVVVEEPASVFIKPEPTEEDEIRNDILTSIENNKASDELSDGVIKRSIEEDIKPVMQQPSVLSTIEADMMEEDSMQEPGAVQEISAAAYAPSGQNRDMLRMFDNVAGMNFDFDGMRRAGRSVAPMDLSSERLYSSFETRYTSKTVTRNTYEEQLKSMYDPDFDVAEGIVRSKVTSELGPDSSTRRAQSGRRSKKPKRTTFEERFMLEAGIKTYVKSSAESSVGGFNDEDLHRPLPQSRSSRSTVDRPWEF